jgi:hypothetical protein
MTDDVETIELIAIEADCDCDCDCGPDCPPDCC